MARPQKVGVEYFPLDVDIDQDDKVAMVEALHGVEGFGVIIKLLMKIYKEGYYYEWTEREQILFSKRVNVDINRVNVIINDSIKWGLFDKSLFVEYEILTSKGIQARYLEIVKRRTRVEFVHEFMLIPLDLVENLKNIVIVDINGVNVDINLENVDISTQSKVKERKEKESILNNNIENSGSSYPQKPVDKSKDEKLSKIATAFEQNGFGTISGIVKDELVGLLDEFSPEWIIEAFKIAVKANKRTLNYVEGILNNWRAQGGMKTESDKPTQTFHKPVKKTGFHNFKSRTEEYTADELNRKVEEKAERKKREYLERIRKQKEDGD